MGTKSFYKSLSCFCTVMTDKPYSLLKEIRSLTCIWTVFQLAQNFVFSYDYSLQCIKRKIALISWAMWMHLSDH